MLRKLPTGIALLFFFSSFVYVPDSFATFSMAPVQASIHNLILQKLLALQQKTPSQVTQVRIVQSLVKSVPTLNSPSKTKTNQTVAVTNLTAQTPMTTSAPSTIISLDKVQSVIMNQINNYRSSLGLYAAKPNNETCSFAKIRAQEIVNNFNHDGFNNRISNHTLPYAHWTNVTENIAMTTDYTQVETMWQNSSAHAKNMRADTPYVCVAQYDNYYAYEGMKP